MRVLSLAVAALLAISTRGIRSPPTADVDLSLPPAQRWNAAIAALAASGETWESSWKPVFENHNGTLFDNLSPAQYASMYASIDKYTFTGFAEELQGLSAGISKTFGNYVSPEYLAAWTWFHDLGHSELAHTSVREAKACTAIVAFNADGVPHHARNLDQVPREVRELTLNLRFVDGDRLLFRGVDWYWFAGGVMTAMMPGSWGVQENWRVIPINSSAVFNAPAGVMPQLLAFRMLMTAGAPSYETAVMKLSTMPFVAPMYVIVSGNATEEGVIIVRDATASTSYSLTTNPACRYCSNFGIVETNAEPGVVSDTRRDTAIRTMNAIGQDGAANPVGMMATISVQPVTNGATAYTVIMVPKTGELHAFIR